MNNHLCPVAEGFLSCTLQLLPDSDEQVELAAAAVECFGGRVPGKAEEARARYLIEYATKTCLPRAFAMFSQPYGPAVLATLPALRHDTHAFYAKALRDLSALVPADKHSSETLLQDSLVRPLFSSQEALALLAAGDCTKVCETLTSLFERLSGNEDLIPVLTALLRITPARPYPSPLSDTVNMPGLSFGFADEVEDVA